MKKTRVALAVLALAALASCQEREIWNDSYIPEDGEILFKISSYAKETKSGDVAATVKSAPIFLGTSGGHEFYLEETVTRLDLASGPETKGTPGYTQNFHKLYGGFNAAAYQVGSSSAYEADGRFEPADIEHLIYKRKYGDDLWDASKGIYFFLRAGEGSGDMADVDLENIVYNATDGTIAFDYDASILAEGGSILASNTKDILFTSRKVLSEQEYNDLISKDKGVSVLFHHVLTGVKFAIGNDASEDTKIKINSVSFSGLYDKGHCVVTPVPENNYKDIIDNYSSGGTSTTVGTSVWSSRGISEDAPIYVSGVFGSPYTFSGGSFNSKGNYPTSFAADGSERNLNDSDASQTFWFVPQAMARTGEAAHVILTVNVTDASGTYDWDIDFTTALSSVEWKAGELRTYTIKIDEVNVKIADNIHWEVDEIDEGDDVEILDFEGSYKENVTITNTGNTDAFIRAAIIGQWLNAEGDPVFGYTDFTAHEVVLIESWYEDQFVKTTPGTHGSFTGLAGYKGGTNPLNDWYYDSSDGYYYYTKVVPAGEEVPSPLFTKYTVGKAPDSTVAGKTQQLFFELEISTQAISARQLNGEHWPSYTDAWANAKAQ